MPRKTQFEPNQLYHIWTHAIGDEDLFREERNYPFFLDKYIQFISAIADTFAYCLMPNHFHFMVRIKNEMEVINFIHKNKKKIDASLQGFQPLGGFGNAVSRQFSHLLNSYTQSYNKLYGRKGSLFIPNLTRIIHEGGQGCGPVHFLGHLARVG